jgi:Pectate lyase superfamily protein
LNFRRRLYAAVFAAAVVSLAVAAHAVGDEEFVGPFPSWANVKTNYGAVGDGVTDDTAAIQKALNALGPNNPTLYFPAGTYKITATLTLAGQQYVNIIGQDPANTAIIWAGSAGGTMLYLNGNGESRFDRLTFNGQGNAAVAIDSSWDGVANFADSGNEFADDVFENVGIGFRCGNLGIQCSEHSLLRDTWINNTVAGVAIKNANALDVFIWYSLFQNNAVGATNSPGAGIFEIYNSIFQGSTTADISTGNTGHFNFRNNYSVGSNRFVSSGGTCAPDLVTIQGNTILDTTNAQSIVQQDLGPVILLDNIIRSSATVTTGPVVRVGSCFGNLFSMGNTFTVSSPTYASGHYHSIQDQVVPRSTVNPSPPLLPGTPPNNHRQIFEVAPGSTAAQIQQVINNAAASGTTKPVVHIQPGSYSINATLAVPAGSDMQIIGDGYYSQLTWTGSTTGPVMRLQGPSKATLRDFSVNGNNFSADGIEVDNADQPGSRVFMEQANLGLSHTNLFVDGLDYTNVELHDFYHAYDWTTGMTSVVVTGGPSAAQGLWQGGATNIFAGASAGNYLGYGVSNGAHVGIRDNFNDAGAGGNLVANVTGTSTFTYAGSALYLPGSAPPVISLNNFQGAAALLNLNTNGDIHIIGNGGTARVLGLGLVGTSAQFFANHSSTPADTAAFLHGQTTANPASAGASELPEQGTADASFLTATLSQIRTEQPTLRAPLPSGVTDARFYRVFVHSAATAVHLKGASLAAPPSVTNGSCGRSNGTKLTRAPTTGLCSTGTALSVSGSGPWAWSCEGSDGGSTASCSAQRVITRHR